MAETARCSHSPRYILAAVSIKQGLWTLWTKDYGLRNGYKTRTRYKTRTTHYGLGIKYGLEYKTRTEHYGLSIKDEERYKIPIFYQVITVHQGSGI